MKNSKVINQSAEFDLTEIASWYNKIDRKLTKKFLKEFREKVNYLADYPSSCEVRFDNIQIAHLKKFPFGIHYTYIEDQRKIIVFSVFHTSRNPDLWTERK